MALRANLNILHNYATVVTICRSVGRALDEIRRVLPDIIFVSNEMRPHCDFERTHRYISQAGFSGPVIVSTSVPTGEDRQKLLSAGATLVIDRDDTHTTSLVAALTFCLSRMEEASAASMDASEIPRWQLQAPVEAALPEKAHSATAADRPE